MKIGSDIGFQTELLISFGLTIFAFSVLWSFFQVYLFGPLGSIETPNSDRFGPFEYQTSPQFGTHCLQKKRK